MRVTLKNGVVLEFDSTGMVEDFKECGRMAEEIGGDGKDCKTCKCILIESQWNLKDDYIIDKDYHWKNINRITVEFKVESEY